MCDTCGCGEPGEEAKVFFPGEKNEESHHNHHHHSHKGEDHMHLHDHSHGERVEVDTDILSANNLLAERNRGYFEGLGIKVINLLSSPGSGKTTLLEKTINEWNGKKKIYVIEGDQQTSNDADRIAATGVKAIQVNTGYGCHLDAGMINRAVNKLKPEAGSLLFIENVGNLVCPSLFDLGEQVKVVIMSVTEGDDKPLKYPTVFSVAGLCIINKTDLLPYVEFDLKSAKENGLKVNHHLGYIEMSATKEEGLDKWIKWLSEL